MKYRALLLLVATALAASDAAAQVRPRVGLVLGGGSARGIAHIGILQWLDEHRVPVDVVIGTSMGGLMGGAFATGMTPAEMKQLVEGVNWDRMFLGESPYDVKTIRRKDDARLYPSRLRFGLKGGLKPPGAMEPGQQINMLLQRIALPYYDLKRFDDLPTPFRCVAVDVRTSEVVVLEDGPLWRAMRATMAIPGVFSPVRVDERVLVDGGVLNNVPTDVARSLDAEVVIAVNVGADGGEALRKPAESYVGALMQTMDVMGSATLARSLSAADIAIRPVLDDIGSLDWRRSDVIIQRGYDAAEAHRAVLSRWSVGDAEYDAWRQARQRVRRTAAPIPGEIQVTGVDAESDIDKIERRFAPLVGRAVDAQTLSQELTAVTGADRFNTAVADFVTDPSGLTMRVAVEEKPYGPPFLLTAVDIRNIGDTKFEIDLRSRITAYDVVGYDSELRLDLGFGTGIDAQAQLYEPIRGSRWFVAGDAGYRRATEHIFSDGEAIAEYRLEQMGVAAEFGLEPSHNSEIRAGYVVGTLDADVRIGVPLLPTVSGAESSLRVRGLYDSMDSPMVPSRGVRISGEVRRYFDTADVVGVEGVPDAAQLRGEAGGSLVRPVRRRDRTFATLAGGTTFGDPTHAPYDFALGGMFRLAAYDPGELRGRNYVAATGGYLLSLGRLKDFLGGGVYMATFLEVGSAFNDARSVDVKGDVTAGLLAETLLGPVFLGGSVGPDGGRALISLAPLFK